MRYTPVWLVNHNFFTQHFHFNFNSKFKIQMVKAHLHRTHVGRGEKGDLYILFYFLPFNIYAENTK